MRNRFTCTPNREKKISILKKSNSIRQSNTQIVWRHATIAQYEVPIDARTRTIA